MSIELTARQIAQMAVDVKHRLQDVIGAQCGDLARDEILAWLEAHVDADVANQAGHLANQMENGELEQEVVPVNQVAQTGGKRYRKKRRTYKKRRV